MKIPLDKQNEILETLSSIYSNHEVIEDIQEVANTFNLQIKSCSFKSNFEDINAVLDKDKKIIFINNNCKLEKINFAIAHEIGHYVLHKEQLSEGQCFLSRSSDGHNAELIEQEANFFAANLLMPENIMRACMYFGYSNKEMARKFHVSEKAIRTRRNNLFKEKNQNVVVNGY